MTVVVTQDELLSEFRNKFWMNIILGIEIGTHRIQSLCVSLWTACGWVDLTDFNVVSGAMRVRELAFNGLSV